MTTSGKSSIQKELLYTLIFTGIGLIALVLVLFNIYRPILIGIVAGFLPTGILNYYILSRIKKDQKAQKLFDAKNDERNTYIRMRAGRTSFWVSFWVVFTLVIVNNIVKIPFTVAGLTIMIFMSILYFALLGYYQQKY